MAVYCIEGPGGACYGATRKLEDAHAALARGKRRGVTWGKIATYVGKNEEGVAFYGAIIGEAEHPRDTRVRKRRAERALAKQIEGKEVHPMPLAQQ